MRLAVKQGNRLIPLSGFGQDPSASDGSYYAPATPVDTSVPTGPAPNSIQALLPWTAVQGSGTVAFYALAAIVGGFIVLHVMGKRK